MVSELEIESQTTPPTQETAESISQEPENNLSESEKVLSKESMSNIPNSTSDSEYKPYFELETEEERLSYEYFKLLARVTYNEVMEKHREQALEELHQSRLSVLLEELRLIEGIDILDSSSDECYSEFRIKIPEKRRSLRIKNKKRRFQKHNIRK